MTGYIIIAAMCLLLVFCGRQEVYLSIENHKRVLYPVKHKCLSHRFQNLLACFMLVGMCILTAFRSLDIGNDTATYASIYTQIAVGGIGIFSSVELGFQYFCWILSRFFGEPDIMFAGCAIISYFFVGKYIFKRSNNIPASVCLFFAMLFSFYMSGLRQSIAMVFVLYAYDWLKRGKKVHALILVLLGMCFHTSAIMALVFFFCDAFPRKINVVFGIMVCVIAFAATGVANRLLQALLGRYGHFFETDRVGTGWLAVSVAVIRHMIFYYFIYKACARNWDVRENRLAYANAFLLLICACLGYSMNLFSRAWNYFLLIACVDLPNALCYRKDWKIWNVLICAILVAYFFVTMIYRPEWNHLYPYEFRR